MTSAGTPIDVTAFEAANSRAYLRAVFEAWGRGDCVMAGHRTVPGTRILSRESFTPDPGWFEAEMPRRPAEDRALLAFSSGTTGRPKAILLQHRALQDVVARINGAMGVDDGIREYLGVPVTYSFGFGRARAVATAGGAAFLPEHGFDPSEIGRMLGRGEINAVSAVPTLWRVLLANKGSIPEESARNLRWIEIGSQWMSAAEKVDLRQLFPNARIVQHYGLTEASRSTLLDITDAPEDRLDSVGRAVGEVEIATSQDGSIRVRGPHLAEGLVNEAGVTPVADEDGWLTTSDRGRIEDGWLYYEGRVDELINVGGLKIDPTAFEQAVNTALGVPGAVAAGRMTDAVRGEKVLVALRQDSGLDRADVARAVGAEATRIGLTGNGAFELREVSAIPVTETGKVKRAELPDLRDTGPAESETDQAGPPAEGTEKTAELQRLWGEILGTDAVPVDKGFYDLGGDSISALTAIMRMENLGIDPEIARGIFQGKTIADLTNEKDTGRNAAASGSALSLAEMMNALHATRGVLVLWVVFIHWLPALLVRLGDGAIWIYHALTSAWRFGTPGFAIVFGMGIGAIRVHHYLTNRPLFYKSARLNTLLVTGSVIVLGLTNLAIVIIDGQFGDRIPMSGLFYSAITYYALALLSLPALIWLITRGQNRLLTILAIGAGAVLIHEALRTHVQPLQPSAFLEFLKITFSAKYGFFRMTGFVMVGVAIGWLFRQHHDRPGVIRDMALTALVMIAFGIAGVSQAGMGWERFGDSFLWHIAVYAGVTMLILSGFSLANRGGGVTDYLPSRINAFAIASGILALPIFVGHEILLRLKQLLDAMGLPDILGLVLVLGLFFGVTSVAYARLMRFLVR